MQTGGYSSDREEHSIFLTYGNTFGFLGNTIDRYDYGILLTWYF